MLANLEEVSESAESPNFRLQSAHQNRLVQVRLGIAGALFASLRSKHAPTAAHSLRVAMGCSSWALSMGLDELARDELEVAALLHDVGKIGTPDHVLLKPGKHTAEEQCIMERQRAVGLEILPSCCPHAGGGRRF